MLSPTVITAAALGSSRASRRSTCRLRAGLSGGLRWVSSSWLSKMKAAPVFIATREATGKAGRSCAWITSAREAVSAASKDRPKLAASQG